MSCIQMVRLITLLDHNRKQDKESVKKSNVWISGVGYSDGYRINKRWLFTILLNSRHKCQDFEWSGFQMVGTIAIAKAGPIENQSDLQ